MISETTFCHQYSSLWRSLAPTCDLFVRSLNDHGRERFAPPIVSGTAPHRRAFVNEIAFNLFANAILSGKRGFAPALSDEELQAATEAARKLISRIGDGRSDSSANLDADETADATEQYRRLWNNLTRVVSPDRVVVRPKFPGCGIVDSCQGDVLILGALYEVKAGDRSIRSIDIRQLITYAALNYVSGEHEIKRIGLINPRMGFISEMDLDDVCFEISGKSAFDMLSDIAFVLSSGDISR